MRRTRFVVVCYFYRHVFYLINSVEKVVKEHKTSEESANTTGLFASMATDTGVTPGALVGGEKGAVVGGASSALKKSLEEK